MPEFRVWPLAYPITVETPAPRAIVGSEDMGLINPSWNSWGDRTWTGAEIGQLRHVLEQRLVAASQRNEMSVAEPGEPLKTIIERILCVAREAERVGHAYVLKYVGD